MFERASAAFCARDRLADIMICQRLFDFSA